MAGDYTLSGKDKNKTNAVRILESAKVWFEVIYYESDGFLDGVSVANKLGEDPRSVFKTLVTCGKSKNYYVFVLPSASELDLKKAAGIVGEKYVEMIKVDDILKITGYIRGGCSPIGMKKQFRTVFDKSALNFDKIMFSGGRRGVQIKMHPFDINKVINCEFFNIIV